MMSSNKRQKSEQEEEVIVYKEGDIVPKNVTKVIFDAAVTEIPANAFSCCQHLKEVVLNEGLKMIGNYAFYGCSLVTIIRLPSTVTEVGDNAFIYCTNLEEVVLNEGLQLIGVGAFLGCSSLERLTLPSTVTEVAEGAFNDCTNLNEVVFKEGLQKIRRRAFENCTSLTIVTLPSSVTKIGEDAFYECTNLREVIFNEGPQVIGKNAFGKCRSLVYIKFSTISKRAKNLIDTGIRGIEDKLTANQYFEWRGGELEIGREAIRSANWKSTRTNLDRVLAWVSYYELREATTTIELALWRIKMGEMGAATVEERAACRGEVPGPAKEAIIQYLEVDIGVGGNESEDDSSQYSDSSDEDDIGVDGSERDYSSQYTDSSSEDESDD